MGEGVFREKNIIHDVFEGMNGMECKQHITGNSLLFTPTQISFHIHNISTTLHNTFIDSNTRKKVKEPERKDASKSKAQMAASKKRTDTVKVRNYLKKRGERSVKSHTPHSP